MKRIGMLVLVATLLLVSACGGRAPAAVTPAPKTASAAEKSQASPTEALEARKPSTAVPVTKATAATNSTDQGSDNAELQLADEESALKSLKSYKTTWSFEWTGKKDGKDQTVKWRSTEEYTAQPLATHTKFETTDSLEPSQNGSMEFYQLGDKTYMVTVQDGKPTCMAFSSEDNKPSGSMLNRNAFGSISNGKFVGAETLNGVRTKHYRYDEKATGVNLFTKLSGDVWVAEDGGYVVKDVAQWEGRLFGLLGGSAAADEVGKGSWTQEVTAINQPFEITAPSGCENAAESLPIMADATEKASFGAMTTYKSTSKLADVVKFYQAEMPKAGWTAEGEAQVTEGFASLAFTRDGKKASIVLTTDDAKVNVMITVE